MSDHFNELLLQTLKDVSIRLERLEGRSDHIINEKADKIDVSDVKTELKAVTEKLDLKADKTDLNDVKAELKAELNDVKAELNDVKAELKFVNEKLDQKADKADLNSLRDEVRSNGQRLDRLEAGIKTLQWMVTAGLAVLGVLIALLKAF